MYNSLYYACNRERSSMRRIVLLALAAAIAATPAAARPRHIISMVRIEVGDLDLASEAGASAMMRRLDAAARTLCTVTRSPLLPGHQGRAWRCRRDAVAAAVARLRTPSLTLAHNAWLSAGPDADPQARSPGHFPSSRWEEGAS
jgi:UrcA family protein